MNSCNPNLNGNNVTVCRLMNQNDANIYGNVHGGVILKMIEEAGLVVSTRYCNLHAGHAESSVTALVRVERNDFLLPMFVGEVAHLHATVTYCSPRSLEVKVIVQSENILKGTKRQTNKAVLWYVPLKKNGEVASVPPLCTLTPEQTTAGQQRYEAQKLARTTASQPMFDDWALSNYNPNSSGEKYTVCHSLTTLVHFVNITDCHMYGKLPGGFAMKIMDEVAGICAARHCKTPCVTASMDATDFHRTIQEGAIINVRGRVIFTSYKSLLVQVVVVVECPKKPNNDDFVMETFVGCSAFFTYVSLDKTGKTLPVPPLQLCSKDERDRFEEGEKFYLRQKQLRKLSQSKHCDLGGCGSSQT